MTSVMVWPRARRNRARHPHTSTVADMTADPASVVRARHLPWLTW